MFERHGSGLCCALHAERNSASDNNPMLAGSPGCYDLRLFTLVQPPRICYIIISTIPVTSALVFTTLPRHPPHRETGVQWLPQAARDPFLTPWPSHFACHARAHNDVEFDAILALIAAD